MATKTLPQPKQLRLIRKPTNRVETEVLLATLTRHLARKEIKSRMDPNGKVDYCS
jgi:hypothetical protein